MHRPFEAFSCRNRHAARRPAGVRALFIREAAKLTALMVIAAGASAVLASHATAQSGAIPPATAVVCVVCDQPERRYRCETIDGKRANPLACIAEIASVGGHDRCRVRNREAAGCQGDLYIVRAGDLGPGPIVLSPNPPSADAGAAGDVDAVSRNAEGPAPLIVDADGRVRQLRHSATPDTSAPADTGNGLPPYPSRDVAGIDQREQAGERGATGPRDAYPKLPKIPDREGAAKRNRDGDGKPRHLLDLTRKAGKQTLETVEKVGSNVDEATRTAGTVVKRNAEQVGDSIRETTKGVGEALEDTGEAIGDAAKGAATCIITLFSDC